MGVGVGAVSCCVKAKRGGQLWRKINRWWWLLGERGGGEEEEEQGDGVAVEKRDRDRGQRESQRCPKQRLRARQRGGWGRLTREMMLIIMVKLYNNEIKTSI